MRNTTAWQIPYPESGDHTRTWEYWQAIAERVDACLSSLSVYCSVEQTVSQNIPQNVATALTFDLKKVDSNGMWAAGNPGRLTCVVAGTYRFAGGLCCSGGGGTYRRATWFKNGNAVSSTPATSAYSATVSTAMPAETILESLVVGDYMELRVLHDGTAATATGAPAGSRSFMTAQRVGI